MLRYHPYYQTIADEFAKRYSNGEWIGVKYLGQYHETCYDALGPGWLTFEPVWKNEDNIVGLFQYILINEEELRLFCDIYTLRHRTIPIESGEIRYTKKIPPKPVRQKRIPRDQQYIVAITTETE